MSALSMLSNLDDLRDGDGGADSCSRLHRTRFAEDVEILRVCDRAPFLILSLV